MPNVLTTGPYTRYPPFAVSSGPRPFDDFEKWRTRLQPPDTKLIGKSAFPEAEDLATWTIERGRVPLAAARGLVRSAAGDRRSTPGTICVQPRRRRLRNAHLPVWPTRPLGLLAGAAPRARRR